VFLILIFNLRLIGVAPQFKKKKKKGNDQIKKTALKLLFFPFQSRIQKMDESDIFGILQVYSNDESKACNICTLMIGDNYLKISKNKDIFLKTNESDPDALFNIILSEKDDYNIEDLGKETGVCKSSKELKNRLKPHKVFELQEDKPFFVENLKFVFFSFDSETFVSWKKEEDERN